MIIYVIYKLVLSNKYWPYGEIGRHSGLKIRKLRVQVPLRPLNFNLGV